MKFKVDDTIKIVNNIHQYTTYTNMAIQLGADVSKYISKHLLESGGSYRNFDYDIAKQDRSCKWIYDESAINGDVCKLINMDGDHYLVERIYDGRQFLMSSVGMKIIQSQQMFSNEEFEL